MEGAKQKLLNEVRENFDIVVVMTPSHVRRKILEIIMQSGCSIFCEKPLAETYAEAAAIAAGADRYGITLAVNQNLRRHFPFEMARDIINGGDIGHPRHLTQTVLRNRRDKGWRLERERYIMSVMSVHWFDGYRYMLGEEPVRVYCSGPENGRLPAGGETAVSVTLDFPSGAVVNLSESFASFSSYSHMSLDCELLRELTASSGISISSISAYSTLLLGPDSGEANEKNRTRIARDIAAATGMEQGGDQSQDIARIERAIDAASALDVRCVSQFAGNDPERDFGENIAKFKDVFTPLARRAEDSGVTLVFENCPLLKGQPPVVNNLAYCPEAWDAMFAAVPLSSIGLELDTGHLPWLGIDLIRCIHDYAPRIKHVHLKDCIIDEEALYRRGQLGGNFYEHGVPGDGGIDFTAVTAALGAESYTGALTLDLRPTNKETVRQGVRYVRSILAKN